jgi:hypothetical protein
MATLPPLQDLLTQIQQAIGPALSPSLTSASAGSDIFEAYILSIILDAAEAEGATITFCNVDASFPEVFTFRTNPGHIWSTAQQYTHAEIQFVGVPLLEALWAFCCGTPKPSSGIGHTMTKR